MEQLIEFELEIPRNKELCPILEIKVTFAYREINSCLNA